jgi:hypothetical protein
MNSRRLIGTPSNQRPQPITFRKREHCAYSKVARRFGSYGSCVLFEDGEVTVIGDEPVNTNYDPGPSVKAVSKDEGGNLQRALLLGALDWHKAH